MFAWRSYPQRDDASPGAYLTVPALASAGIRVAFTARAGGRSGDPFSSLNLSYVSGDDANIVRANRARALGAIGAPLGVWTSGRQVHGARVAEVGKAELGCGADDPSTTIADTDALVTSDRGTVLAVLTADCVPIVIADRARRRVAAVHAGWRGLVGGVIDAAAKTFERPGECEAFIGPAIGPCCYEVGSDVTGPARDVLGNAVIAAPRGANTTERLDLWRGARIALMRAGIAAISLSALCTRCEPNRFYSHRAGHTGRQGALVLIEP